MSEESKQAKYITTTIPYVNAEPHIGFALEAVQADVLARAARLSGQKVFYNAGSDEHGQKIWQKANEAGEETQAYVDRFAKKVKELKELLNLDYDNFIRTSSSEHKEAAQAIWQLCDQKGDIYKKKYQAPYCVGCEKFLQKRDLDENGECPFHPGQKPVMLEEENYFFKFSNYQKVLEDYLARAEVIIPPHRLEEARQFVESGLEDFSISREKEKLPWGVPVPGDPYQVMYVWFDALTCYISTLGWPADKEGNFAKFWEQGEVIQMAGKDQVRFQSIIWPAMLSSAGIKVPDQIFYHGFINSGGQRMSKSLGNIIKPKDLVDRYGSDATRYLLLRHVHPTEDTDITWERLDEWYTANLVNGLGNLVARVTKMAENYDAWPKELKSAMDTSVYEELVKYQFMKASDLVWEKIGKLDQTITDTEPFKVFKTNPNSAREIVSKLVEEIYALSFALEPLLPETANQIQTAISAHQKPENLFNRLNS